MRNLPPGSLPYSIWKDGKGSFMCNVPETGHHVNTPWPLISNGYTEGTSSGTKAPPGLDPTIC